MLRPIVPTRETRVYDTVPTWIWIPSLFGHPCPHNEQQGKMLISRPAPPIPQLSVPQKHDRRTTYLNGLRVGAGTKTANLRRNPFFLLRLNIGSYDRSASARPSSRGQPSAKLYLNDTRAVGPLLNWRKRGRPPNREVLIVHNLSAAGDGFVPHLDPLGIRAERVPRFFAISQ